MATEFQHFIIFYLFLYNFIHLLFIFGILLQKLNNIFLRFQQLLNLVSESLDVFQIVIFGLLMKNLWSYLAIVNIQKILHLNEIILLILLKVIQERLGLLNEWYQFFLKICLINLVQVQVFGEIAVLFVTFVVNLKQLRK